MSIIGYAHKDGYIICLSCMSAEEIRDAEKEEKINFEIIFKPVFDSDEFDYYPSCDRCLEKITEIVCLFHCDIHQSYHCNEANCMAIMDIIREHKEISYFDLFDEVENNYNINGMIKDLVDNNKIVRYQRIDSHHNNKIRTFYKLKD